MLRRQYLGLMLVACVTAAVWSGSAGGQDAAVPGDIAWRTDYNHAVVEAEKRGLPVFIEFTSNDCFWCRKLEETTFRDPRVVALLSQQFVTLKINVAREPKLANDLRIDRFPTLVIAAPGRKILYMKEGYHEAEAMIEVLQRCVPHVATPDWMKHQFDVAQKAYHDGDYGRAYATLRNILEDSKGRGIHANAQRLLGDIEAKAKERFERA
ncbi:MAG: thioredoxin family protein, partial [Gemmataceae bacterium]|nr:thioredoxin family protein [Gemmataceae bacterium]